MSETAPPPELFTVGHSNREPMEFVMVLQAHGVTAIADVRSAPYSGRYPHFNREPLSETLRRAEIAYVFLGEELGARRTEPDCYTDGQVRFDRVRESPLFRSGLDRVRTGLQTHRIALMCAERDPLHCHRFGLISRTLREEMTIRHLIDATTVESQSDAEQRLRRLAGLPDHDLFRTESELIAEAYHWQADRVAYRKTGDEQSDG